MRKCVKATHTSATYLPGETAQVWCVTGVCVCVCMTERQTQRKEKGVRIDGDLPSPGAQSPKQAGPAALFLLLVFSEHRGPLPLKHHVKTERGCLIRGQSSKETQ